MPIGNLRRGLAAWLLIATPIAAVAFEPETLGNIATLPSDRTHFVWVPDRLLGHSLLYDGQTGDVVATIDSPASLSPKSPLLAASRGEFYSVDLDYSRGRRGDRIDYVTIYDATTLEVTGEVVLPHRTSESNASLHHAALLDGDGFLVVFSQFPLPLATVVDLERRSVAAEIPMTGCAGVYATGARSFATLCGDGTVVQHQLAEDGRLASRIPSESFFDVVDDPAFMSAGRTGDTWHFVTFLGVVHGVRFAEDAATVTGSWSLVSDEERAAGWRPGGLQLVAAHAGAGLYVVMHEGEPGSHKRAGPEIWRYDLATREREARIVVPNLAASFLATQLGLEADGWAEWLLQLVVPPPGAHTIAISSDDAPLLFVRSAELGVVAVLDARTGEHLHDLDEAGLFGPQLGAL